MPHGVRQCFLGSLVFLLVSPALPADDSKDPTIEGKLLSEWVKDLSPQKNGKRTRYGKNAWQAIKALHAHRTELKDVTLARQAIPGLMGLFDESDKNTPVELVELVSEICPENPEVLTGIVKSQGNRAFSLHGQDIRYVVGHFHPKTMEALPALATLADKASGYELAIIRHLTNSMKVGREDRLRLAKLIKEHSTVAEEMSLIAARSGIVPVEAAPYLVGLLKSVETSAGGMCCVPGLATRGDESELAAKGLTLLGPDAVTVLPQLIELLKYQAPAKLSRFGAVDPEPAQQTARIHERVLQVLEKMGPGARKAAPDLEKLANDKNCPGRLAARRAFALVDPEAARKKFPCDPKLLGVWEVVAENLPLGDPRQKPSAEDLASNGITYDLRYPGLVGIRGKAFEFEAWLALNTAPDLKPSQFRVHVVDTNDPERSLEIRGLYQIDKNQLTLLLPELDSDEALKKRELPKTFPAADKVPAGFVLQTLKRVKAAVKARAPTEQK